MTVRAETPMLLGAECKAVRGSGSGSSPKRAGAPTGRGRYLANTTSSPDWSRSRIRTASEGTFGAPIRYSFASFSGPARRRPDR